MAFMGLKSFWEFQGMGPRSEVFRYVFCYCLSSDHNNIMVRIIYLQKFHGFIVYIILCMPLLSRNFREDTDKEQASSLARIDG